MLALEPVCGDAASGTLGCASTGGAHGSTSRWFGDLGLPLGLSVGAEFCVARGSWLVELEDTYSLRR